MSTNGESKDLVLDELRKIEERDGVLKPDAVVEFAKNKKTALHKQFNWDDSDAAKKYRVWQARQLIRIKVVLLKSEDNNVETKAFVHFDSDDNNEEGYRYIVTVLNDDLLKEQMLANALKELQIFKKKYNDLRSLAELKEIFEAIDAIPV